MAMNKARKILTVGKNVPWIASQRGISAIKESYYEEDHKQMQSTLRKIIDADINPHVDQWEQEGMSCHGPPSRDYWGHTILRPWRPRRPQPRPQNRFLFCGHRFLGLGGLSQGRKIGSHFRGFHGGHGGHEGHSQGLKIGSYFVTIDS